MATKTVTGVRTVNKNLEKYEDGSKRKIKGVIVLGLNLIESDSVKQVPRDTGVLATSIYTDVFEKGKEIIGEVGYGALYAPFVHENKRSGKTGGISPQGQLYRSWASRGKWKFLEDPFKRYKSTILRMIKKAVGGKI